MVHQLSASNQKLNIDFGQSTRCFTVYKNTLKKSCKFFENLYHTHVQDSTPERLQWRQCRFYFINSYAIFASVISDEKLKKGTDVGMCHFIHTKFNKNLSVDSKFVKHGDTDQDSKYLASLSGLVTSQKIVPGALCTRGLMNSRFCPDGEEINRCLC